MIINLIIDYFKKIVGLLSTLYNSGISDKLHKFCSASSVQTFQQTSQSDHFVNF